MHELTWAMHSINNSIARAFHRTDTIRHRCQIGPPALLLCSNWHFALFGGCASSRGCFLPLTPQLRVHSTGVPGQPDSGTPKTLSGTKSPDFVRICSISGSNFKVLFLPTRYRKSKSDPVTKWSVTFYLRHPLHVIRRPVYFQMSLRRFFVTWAKSHTLQIFSPRRLKTVRFDSEIRTSSEHANSKPRGDHLYHISRRYGPE